MLFLSGCDYHPYHDGQKFRIYNSRYGMIETDGTHMYVPIVTPKDFVIEVYGGKGKKHNVVVDDPQYVSYTYEKADVEGGLFGDGIIPTKLIINPLELGDTSILISDEDTGESIQVFIHVIRAYSTMEVLETQNSLEKGIVFAFEYESPSDVVKICRMNEETYNIEFMYDARFRFLDYDSTVAFELTYLADADGQPSADGEETVKLFMVQFYEGGDFGDAYEMLRLINLGHLPITRAAMPDWEYEYYEWLKFVEITDDGTTNDFFYTRSAQLNPIFVNEK